MSAVEPTHGKTPGIIRSTWRNNLPSFSLTENILENLVTGSWNCYNRTPIHREQENKRP